MKYRVKMSCGHMQEMELFGCQEHIEDKINFFKTRSVCGKCYMKEQLKNNLAAGYEEIRVSYHDYKFRYKSLPYIPDSYNKADRTIIVCMPPDIAARAAERKAQQEKIRAEREEKKRLEKATKSGTCSKSGKTKNTGATGTGKAFRAKRAFKTAPA